MPAKILFRDATGRDGAVDLRMDPVWVGRAMDCAIRTDDAMVSRKHSMIRFDQGRYWVEDLGSSNGTHVNDVKVTRQALNHNDVVRCGSLWLRYIEEGPIGMSGGMGGGMGASPPPVAAPPSDFGFASTVATPRTQAPPSTTGGMTGFGSSGGGGGRGSVVVDMGDSGEVNRYRSQVEELRSQFEQVRAERDKEVAENKRLRAEQSNMQQRLEDAKTQIKETEEVIEAHKRVAEELRAESLQLRERDGRLSTQASEAQEDLASRNRQLQRAQDDITKIKQEIDQYKRQTSELSKMKDEGFKKLNDQLAEVEHLREVIREQERMLEERRVGLISLEEAIKELRADREHRIKEVAQLKGERDELRIGFNRQVAQMQATDEENRRLGRLMQDIQAGGADTGEVTRLSAEVKALRFENKRLDSEVNRLEGAVMSAEKATDKLQADLSRLESHGAEDEERIRGIEREKHQAEEARIKAESGRMRAEDDKTNAIKARDELAAEVERLKRRLADAENDARSSTSAPAAGPDPQMAKRLADAEAAQAVAENRAEELTRVRGELEEKLRKAESAANTSAASKKGGGGGGGDPAIRDKAGEIYQSINDVLAELRVNLSVVKDEFAALSGKTADPRSRTIRDAIDAASGQTEDVRGVLRGLRELAEG